MTMPAVVERPKRYTVKDATGKVIGKAELRSVPVAVIKLDHAYQRDTYAQWVEEHRPFDPQQAGAIVLSSRAGGPYCIDGGHRLALAAADGVSHVNAFVIDGLTQADEARLFTRYQRERRNLTSWALFRADLVSGDPATAEMVRVVNRAGFAITDKAGRGPYAIKAIDAVRYVFGYGGEDLLDRVLVLIKEMWLGEAKATSASVIRGLALFLSSSGQQPAFRAERLRKVMERHGPSKVERLAQGIAMNRNAASVGPANFAEALIEEYNKLVPKGEEKLPTLTISGKRRPRAGGAER